MIEFTTSCDAKLDVFLREMTEIYCSLEIFLGYVAVLGSTLHVRGVRRSTFSKSAHCGPGISSNRSWQSLMSQCPASGAGAAHESWPYRGIPSIEHAQKKNEASLKGATVQMHSMQESERSPSDMIHARCL